MKGLRRYLERLASAVRRGEREALTTELETHFELMVEDHVRQGLAPPEARREAARRLGGRQTIAEQCHDQRVLPLLDTLPRDVRLAVRRLVGEPIVGVVCVLTFAVAIGANTAIFSAVNAALLRPLPYPDAERLVQVWETNPSAERWGDWASFPDFEDWARDTRAFEALALYRSGRISLTDGEDPEMLVAVRATPSLLRVLHVDPAHGRAFLPDEGRPGRTDVAILSDGLWRRRFGADPGIVGRAIPLDGRMHLVVGVMPPDFDFPSNLQEAARRPDVWIPVVPDTARGSHNYRVIGRLEAGHTVAQARDDLARAVRAVGERDPDHQGRGAAVAGLQAHAVAAVRPGLLLVMGAVALVLVVACANVSSLLLARGATRQRELALRRALGASASRVLQQGIVEGLLLALLGGGAGLFLAHAGLGLLLDLAPAMALLKQASLDVRVLAFALVAALATGVGAGILPTMQAVRLQANDVLKEGGARHTAGARVSALRSALTIGEVAISLVLLIGSALLVQSFANVRRVELGFDPVGVVTASLAAPPGEATEPMTTTTFFTRVMAAIEDLPGVRAVGGSSAVPLISNETSPFRVEGVEPGRQQDLAYAEQPKVTSGYLDAMGIVLLSGRLFSDADVSDGEPVAIVSRGLADRYWPAGDPLGQRVAITDGTWRRIIGVVADVRNDGLEAPAKATIYIPFGQFPRTSITLVVRTSRDVSATLNDMREALRDVAPAQPLYNVQTLEQVVGASLSLRRFLMLLLASFAGLALVLGLVGVYGVLAYLVGQRRQEIAIRVALGATSSAIVWLVARRGLVMACTGIAVGLMASFVLSRLLEGTLVGVGPLDPLTYLLASALLLTVVIAASSLPAWRAARLNRFTAPKGE